MAAPVFPSLPSGFLFSRRLPPRRRLIFRVLGLPLLAAYPAAAQYSWIGTNTGETDAGVRRTVHNGDSASLFSELNWENLASPGTRPLDNAINNSSQSPAGNDAALVVSNGAVAGGMNGAGLGTAHCRSNGFPITVSGANSGIKMVYTSTGGAMIQNDGVSGGSRSTLTIGDGAFVTAHQLQDISATVSGPGARLFLASNNAIHAGLDQSVVDLQPVAGGYPEVFWVNNTLANVTGALAANSAVTLGGSPLVWGDSPQEIEPGDNVVFIGRTAISFSTFKQLPGNAGTTNGVSLRVVDPVTPHYWDTNGATAGAGGEDPLDEFAPHLPDGTWGDSTANWSTSPQGDVATTGWPSGGVASFAAGNALTGFYVVTVTGTRTVGGLIVENGTLDLSGGTLAFTGGEISLGNGASLLLDSAVTGAPPVRVEGSSSLVLSSDQTFGGLRGSGAVNAGIQNLTLDHSQQETYWGTLSGAGILIKKGSGELKLVRSMGGFSGEVDLQAGKLTLAKIQGNQGAIEQAAVIRIRAGAAFDTVDRPTTISGTQTLTGSGSVAAQDRLTYTGTNFATQTVTTTPGLTIQGTVEPGDGVGTLTVTSGTTRFAAGSVLRAEIHDATTAKCDTLHLAGSLSVVAGATLDLAVTGTPTQAVYELVRYTGTPPATAFTVTNLPAGYELQMARGGNTVALVKPSGYEEWAAASGIPDASFDADGPDSDGIPNGVEYALGLNPTAPDVLPGLVPSGNGHTLTLPKGTQAAADPALIYRFQTSTDLSVWTPADPTQQSGTSFSYHLSQDGPRKFLRVHISRSSP